MGLNEAGLNDVGPGAGRSITAPALPARPDPMHERVLADPTLLADIECALGGPFHLLYPDRMRDTIGNFRAVFEKHCIDGAIYYAKKANKAAAFAGMCAASDIGAEVSTVGELTAALACGVRGTDLLVSGPAKSAELLWLAARHGALIAVDYAGELDHLLAIPDPGTLRRILLRVRPPVSSSRFGLTEAELSAALERIDPAGPIELEGFGFHLTGYAPEPRSTLTAALIDRCRAARALGHDASTISLGGGFGVDYIDADAWAGVAQLHDGHRFHGGRPGSGGLDDYYPYHCTQAGADMLDTILDTASLGERLRSAHLRLVIEPGRALLDQAGCTVFPVRAVREREDPTTRRPYLLVTVDGTSFSLSEQWFGTEFLPDPVLWPLHPGNGDTSVPTCVGGASCLETDMLSRRRIPMARAARPEDLLIYPNTAGYQMDSNESSFQEIPLPPKVVVHEGPSGCRWSLDRSLRPGKVL